MQEQKHKNQNTIQYNSAISIKLQCTAIANNGVAASFFQLRVNITSNINSAVKITWKLHVTK